MSSGPGSAVTAAYCSSLSAARKSIGGTSSEAGAGISKSIASSGRQRAPGGKRSLGPGRRSARRGGGEIPLFLLSGRRLNLPRMADAALILKIIERRGLVSKSQLGALRESMPRVDEEGLLQALSQK